MATTLLHISLLLISASIRLSAKRNEDVQSYVRVYMYIHMYVFSQLWKNFRGYNFFFFFPQLYSLNNLIHINVTHFFFNNIRHSAPTFSNCIVLTSINY